MFARKPNENTTGGIVSPIKRHPDFPTTVLGKPCSPFRALRTPPRHFSGCGAMLPRNPRQLQDFTAALSVGSERVSSAILVSVVQPFVFALGSPEIMVQCSTAKREVVFASPHEHCASYKAVHA